MKILVIIAVAIIITFMVYAIANKIRNHKIISILLFLILIIIISIFTNIQRNTEKQHAKIINLFNRNKIIICDEIKVSKKDFNFISGTLVFMGKEKSDFQAQIIPLNECSLEK
jgi:hypothetical protein